MTEAVPPGLYSNFHANIQVPLYVPISGEGSTFTLSWWFHSLSRSAWNKFIAVFCASTKCRSVFYIFSYYFWRQNYYWI